MRSRIYIETKWRIEWQISLTKIDRRWTCTSSPPMLKELTTHTTWSQKLSTKTKYTRKRLKQRMQLIAKWCWMRKSKQKWKMSNKQSIYWILTNNLQIIKIQRQRSFNQMSQQFDIQQFVINHPKVMPSN